MKIMRKLVIIIGFTIAGIGGFMVAIYEGELEFIGLALVVIGAGLFYKL